MNWPVSNRPTPHGDTLTPRPHREDTQRWYSGLDERQRRLVGRWLEWNPPPNRWTGTGIDYAYCEMPSVLLVIA